MSVALRIFISRISRLISAGNPCLLCRAALIDKLLPITQGAHSTPVHAHLQNRIKNLRRDLKEKELDAMIIKDRVNTYYFTEFRCSSSILIIDSRRRPIFITDARYAEMAEKALDGFDIRVQPKEKVKEWLAAQWKKRNYARAGFEGSITVDERDGMRKWTRGTKLVKADDLILALRIVKGEEEIRLIRRAVRLADKLMEHVIDYVQPGIDEHSLSRIIRSGAEQLGGEGESFENIVASGPNSSRPHHHPTARRLRRGDPLTIDLGIIYRHYCSDLTRTPVLSLPSRKFQKIYDVCLRANEAAIKAIKPGMTGKEVDAVAREVIAEAGYGEYFGHGLGHGVGLEIHEAPRLSPNAGGYKLQPGNVVTIEPGIYIPGVAGVRIEDYVLLTEKGALVLSKSPKVLRILN